MKILAVETSCDDTCVAIAEITGETNPRFRVLANVVSSQIKIHQKWGGVYPMLAKREHIKNLPLVLKKALAEAKNPKIDLMAITMGPGLEPCLWTGINFAQDLSKKWKIPLVPVNHIEAHILANFVGSNFQFFPPLEGSRRGGTMTNFQKFFPAVCLVVSGGHTQLILMKNFGNYKILGETRDDAAGECFDKTARILGLGYPGGPAIAANAAKLQATSYKLKTKLPRPMIYQKNYDFSFSGLKTAVLYEIQDSRFKIQSKKYIQAMATEIQQAIIDVLIAKTLRATKEYKAKTIILGGGVVANKELRRQFKKQINKITPDTKYLIPDAKYCTDNATMIAVTAYYNWRKKGKSKIKNIEAMGNLMLK